MQLDDTLQKTNYGDSKNMSSFKGCERKMNSVFLGLWKYFLWQYNDGDTVCHTFVQTHRM